MYPRLGQHLLRATLLFPGLRPPLAVRLANQVQVAQLSQAVAAVDFAVYCINTVATKILHLDVLYAMMAGIAPNDGLSSARRAHSM